MTTIELLAKAIKMLFFGKLWYDGVLILVIFGLTIGQTLRDNLQFSRFIQKNFSLAGIITILIVVFAGIWMIYAGPWNENQVTAQLNHRAAAHAEKKQQICTKDAGAKVVDEWRKARGNKVPENGSIPVIGPGTNPVSGNSSIPAGKVTPGFDKMNLPKSARKGSSYRFLVTIRASGCKQNGNHIACEIGPVTSVRDLETGKESHPSNIATKTHGRDGCLPDEGGRIYCQYPVTQEEILINGGPVEGPGSDASPEDSGNVVTPEEETTPGFEI